MLWPQTVIATATHGNTTEGRNELPNTGEKCFKLETSNLSETSIFGIVNILLRPMLFYLVELQIILATILILIAIALLLAAMNLTIYVNRRQFVPILRLSVYYTTYEIFKTVYFSYRF